MGWGVLGCGPLRGKRRNRSERRSGAMAVTLLEGRFQCGFAEVLAKACKSNDFIGFIAMCEPEKL
jgi:hypothetical protein